MNPTPTISEAARRATEQIGHAIYNDTFVFRPEFAEKVAAVVQSALDSAHPAPKEGETDALIDSLYNSKLNMAEILAKVEGHARSLELRLSDAKREVEALQKGQPINTHVRLFDLVRHQRAELHQAGLITDEEYFWLCSAAKMANDPKGGSPSPRRLEDYDSLRSHLKTANELLGEAHAMFLPPESDFGHTPPKAALLSRIRTHLTKQSK